MSAGVSTCKQQKSALGTGGTIEVIRIVRVWDGSQNGLEGDSQAARLEKGPGRQQLLRGLNWHPPTPLPAASTHPGINPLLPIFVLPPRDPGESSQGTQPGGTATAHHGWESTAFSLRVPERWAVPGLFKGVKHKGAGGDSPEKTLPALVFTL